MKAPAKIKSLDPQQMQFVASFIERGGRPTDGPSAACDAGYAENEKDARRAAAILLSTPAIVDVIKEDAAARFGALTIAAVATIADLCENGPPSVRLAAAKEILDRGIGPIISRNAVVQASMGLEELLAVIDAEDSGKGSD